MEENGRLSKEQKKELGMEELQFLSLHSFSLVPAWKGVDFFFAQLKKVRIASRWRFFFQFYLITICFYLFIIGVFSTHLDITEVEYPMHFAG